MALEITMNDRFTLQIFAQAGLPRPEMEFRFHPERKFRFDFAWPEQKIALEVEGAVWTKGRHTRPAGFLRDIVKYNLAAQMGWRVVRCTPQELHSNDTILMLKKLLQPV